MVVNTQNRKGVLISIGEIRLTTCNKIKQCKVNTQTFLMNNFMIILIFVQSKILTDNNGLKSKEFLVV